MDLLKIIFSINGCFCVQHYEASDGSDVIIGIINNYNINDDVVDDMYEVMSSCINGYDIIMETDPKSLIQ